MELSREQQAVWDTIVAGFGANRRFPAPHELRHALGVSPARVRQQLKALARKGLLEVRSVGPGRTPEMAFTAVGMNRARLGVPVVGAIRGGPLSEAVFDLTGYLDVPGRQGWFALRVVGDSMADLILDGDLVLLEGGVEPRPGEICAVRVNGYDATLKRLQLDPGRGLARLEPQNPLYALQEVPLTELHVDGVYRTLMRGDLRGILVEEPV